MDEIDNLIQMAADAQKRSADAQRDYRDLKDMIAKRIVDHLRSSRSADPAQAVACTTTTTDPPTWPTKAPVVDGVIDYDAAYKAQIEAWHKRHTYPMERVAREILRTISAAPTGRWMRLNRFREINAPLHAQNSLGIGRAAVRLGAVVALVDSDAVKKQQVIERWKRLAMAGRGELQVDGDTPIGGLVYMVQREQTHGRQAANEDFFFLSWSAMSDGPRYSGACGWLNKDAKRLALQQLQTFSAWMAGSDS